MVLPGQGAVEISPVRLSEPGPLVSFLSIRNVPSDVDISVLGQKRRRQASARTFLFYTSRTCRSQGCRRLECLVSDARYLRTREKREKEIERDYFEDLLSVTSRRKKGRAP